MEKGPKIERLILSPNDGKKNKDHILLVFKGKILKKQILYNLRNRP